MTAARRRPVWIENGDDWRDREVGYLISRPNTFGRPVFTLEREPEARPVGFCGVRAGVRIMAHGLGQVVQLGTRGGTGLRTKVQPLALDVVNPPSSPALEPLWT